MIRNPCRRIISADFFKLSCKLVLPREGADRVRGKRHEIGRDPEEEHAVNYIIGKDLFQAGEISADGLPHPLFSIRRKPEGAGGGAANRAVDTGITDAHGSSFVSSGARNSAETSSVFFSGRDRGGDFAHPDSTRCASSSPHRSGNRAGSHPRDRDIDRR